MRAALVERVARRVDVIKVMTSGGGFTPGTDMLRTQFDTERLRLLVELSHASGRPVAAHAHGLVAIEQAVEVGVDTIEHCSGMTDGGMELPDTTLAAMAEQGIAVSGIIPIRADLEIADTPKPVQEFLSRTGLTLVGVRDFRMDMIRRLPAEGVAVVTGLDSSLNPGLGHGKLAGRPGTAWHSSRSTAAIHTAPAPLDSQPSSTGFRAMGSVQAYARYALQLHRPDLGEGHVYPRGAIDDLLCDEDLTRPGVLGDP